MSIFVIDIESVGPIPGDYSMIEIGAVLLKKGSFDCLFSAGLNPINNNVSMDTLNAIGRTREQAMTTHPERDPFDVMRRFKVWVKRINRKGSRPIFFSDNNGFDFMFTHWYFMHFIKDDPFGHSSRNIGDLYCGAMRSRKTFKHLRETEHTHFALDDAIGNTEALRTIIRTFDLDGYPIEPELWRGNAETR